jgi:hypothetical protein
MNPDTSAFKQARADVTGIEREAVGKARGIPAPPEHAQQKARQQKRIRRREEKIV